MEIREIRIKLLKDLVSQAGGIAPFARQHEGVDPTYISQLLNGHRSFGEKAARNMEIKIGVNSGYLDGNVAISGAQELIERGTHHISGIDTRPPASPTDVFIRQFDAAGSMGHGLVLRDQPGVIQNLQVNKEWLEKNVKTYTSVRNLAVVTGFGDSMKPMFNSGDPLLIDIGVKAVEYEGIYFFRIGDEGYIKRLQRIPTEDGLIIRAKSENSAYDPFDITKKMNFEVLGVVLKVWCSTDY